MPKFEVLVLPIDKIEDHPYAERLSLNHIRGFVAISNKVDGAHRYQKGQLVAYVPEGAIVPISLLKARGYWDEKKEKGFLSGLRGNIVKAINLRGIVSRGLIFPTDTIDDFVKQTYLVSGEGHQRRVQIGDDVSGFLGITKSQNPYLINPPLGDIIHISYEVEDLKKFPHLLDNQQVIITELLHGILCIVGYDRRLNEPFFVADGTREKDHVINPLLNNIYTITARPIWEDIRRYLKEMPAVERFYIFGEIIGPGIQDITYGLESTEFRALDIQMGLMGAGRDSIPFGFVGTRKYDLFRWLNIFSAPILWAGRFDQGVIDQLTDGPSSIGGGLRKGVVITAEDENFIEGKRPILKNISDKYLLRTKGTEFK
jgi:RNA ligase (TIGR02306 family)